MRTVILYLILLFSACASAQTVSYGYDATGNRVRREIVISQARQWNAPERQYAEALSRDCDVRLRPWGQQGVILVEATVKTGVVRGAVEAYTVGGVKVAEATLKDGRAEVSLAGSPAGVYVLKITANGKQTNWKVTKQ